MSAKSSKSGLAASREKQLIESRMLTLYRKASELKTIGGVRCWIIMELANGRHELYSSEQGGCGPPAWTDIIEKTTRTPPRMWGPTTRPARKGAKSDSSDLLGGNEENDHSNDLPKEDPVNLGAQKHGRIHGVLRPISNHTPILVTPGEVPKAYFRNFFFLFCLLAYAIARNYKGFV